MESRDGDLVESERPLQGYYGYRSRAQCCCREDQMAQSERWGLWPPMSQYFPRPPFPSQWLNSPDQVWEKLSEIFGKTDEMRGHQIENELISLSPSNFESLQLYFFKFKALVLQLKRCGIENKDDQLILAIISKLGPDYSLFVSTFYATKHTARTWKMRSLAYFMESLTQ